MFLSRLFRPRPALPPAEPGWVDELRQLNQKVSRAQVKLSLQLEAVERKTEAGFSDVRAEIARLSAASDPHGGAWLELLDVADALVAAADLSIHQPELRGGLLLTLRRLEGALAKAGYQRVDALGAMPDGARYRVVGSHPDPSLPEGAVSRVIRAAVIRQGALLREGEALTNRSPT